MRYWGHGSENIYVLVNFFLHRVSMSVFTTYDALARAYGPSWLCNDVTRPFWQTRSSSAGPERELDMVAIQGGVYGPRTNAGSGRIRGPLAGSLSLQN